jgi:hypothetical protein
MSIGKDAFDRGRQSGNLGRTGGIFHGNPPLECGIIYFTAISRSIEKFVRVVVAA